MNCEECRNSVYDYLDGELSPANQRAFEAALAECAECRDRLAFAREVRASVQQLPADLGLAAERRQTILAAAHRKIETARDTSADESARIVQWLPARAWSWGLAAAAVLACVLGFWIVQTQREWPEFQREGGAETLAKTEAEPVVEGAPEVSTARRGEAVARREEAVARREEVTEERGENGGQRADATVERENRAAPRPERPAARRGDEAAAKGLRVEASEQRAARNGLDERQRRQPVPTSLGANDEVAHRPLSERGSGAASASPSRSAARASRPSAGDDVAQPGEDSEARQRPEAAGEAGLGAARAASVARRSVEADHAEPSVRDSAQPENDALAPKAPGSGPRRERASSATAGREAVEAEERAAPAAEPAPAEAETVADQEGTETLRPSLRRIRAHLEAGAFEEASRLGEALAQGGAGSPEERAELYFLLGTARERMDDRDGAIRFYQRSVDQGLGSSGARTSYQRLQSLLGR